MSERFYVPKLLDESSVSIEGDEARHMIRVMRMNIGDTVFLFDGCNRQATAQIAQINKNALVLSIAEVTEISREPDTQVTVASALPKGDRLKFMVEKLTEIGVTRLIPVIFERSSVLPKPNTVEKIRRYVIEASKQCERNQLLSVTDAIKATKLFAHSKGPHLIDVVDAGELGQLFVCRPNADLNISDAVKSSNGSSQVTFAIGPEGGLTDREFQEAVANGWKPIQFGPRVLRTETAAIFASSLAIGYG